MKPNKLPPFQADVRVLEIAPTPHNRILSADTINLLVLALDQMHYNRYWTNDGYDLEPEQIAAKNALLDRAILEVLLDVDLDQATPGAADAVLQQIVGGAGGYQPDECEEDMPYILRLDGTAYLVDNCGCGDSLLYALTPSNYVSGNGILLPAQTTPDVSFNHPVPGDYQACYAEAATEYLMSRAVEYHHFLVGLATQGIDFLAGNVDEIGQWLLLLADILNGEGDIPDLAAIAEGQVQTVLNSAAVLEPLAAAWTYTGSVSSFDLLSWVQAAPNYVSGVPVQILLDLWAAQVLHPNLNATLAVLAAECESGLDSGIGNPPALPGGEILDLEYLEYSGLTYPITTYTWSSPGYVLAAQGDKLYVPDHPDIQAILFEFQSTDVSQPPDAGHSWRISLGNDADGDYGNSTNIKDDALQSPYPVRYGIYKDAADLLVLQQLATPITYTFNRPNIETEVTYAKHSYYFFCVGHVKKIWIVGTGQ